jgi:NADH:ubiquinone oxidoreductase subunit 3 (subunit A)
MIKDILLSPPAAACIFLALTYGLYKLGGMLAAPGEEHPGKYQPYASGEDLPPPRAQLAYHDFFHLALMFAILHLATLVVTTLPPEGASHRIALAYLVGIGISVLVLTKRELTRPETDQSRADSTLSPFKRRHSDGAPSARKEPSPQRPRKNHRC